MYLNEMTFIALLWCFFLPLNLNAANVNMFSEMDHKCPPRAKIIYPCYCLKGTVAGVFIKCENFNLATLAVALQQLSSIESPVEELTLYNGHIVHLYGSLFSKIRARKLKFVDVPIEKIYDNVFHGINKTLEEVTLLRTNLSSISALSFGNLGKLTQFVVDGHNVSSFNKNIFVGQEISNRLEVIRFINGPLADIPIEMFQPLQKLKILDLHGNQIKNLKRNQFKNLRSVELLDISFNKITKLESQHIADLSKLGWFNISHNALTELSRGTFARNSVLKLLNMSNNQISRLDVNSFRGMRFLRRLFLNDNNIFEIGRGTFGSIARIGTIDLARNALKKIEFQMFSQLNYVEILNLAENNISLIEKNAFKDIYQALINISHNSLEVIQPYAFENCVNITVLDLSHNLIRDFSKNAFDSTTFATELQVSHNLLTNLGQIPIHNMTGLKILNATYNLITEIPKNYFPKLYDLHTLDFSHNSISYISGGVFQTLLSLRNLNLSYNNMKEIRSSIFGTLPTLIEMDVSYNNLTSIYPGALIKLTSLRVLNLNKNKINKIFQIPLSLNQLYLSGNIIKEIPAETWPVMNSLLNLDLSNNQLGDLLNANSFSELLVLQRLNIDYNGITAPPIECLTRIPTLQYLDLQHNNITTLEKNAFGTLPVLFKLNLHNNGINIIRKRAFEGLLQLQSLNLSGNALSNIPNDAFMGLPSLRTVDLSFNDIEKLDNTTNSVLDDLLSLEKLNLSYNKISFITKTTFPSSPYVPYNLKYLNLSHNQMPVLTYDITFGTKKVIELDLSNNQINEIRRGVLANLTSLQYLDLSNNELSDLKTDENIFDLPKNLTYIFLANNRLFNLPFEKFNADTSLNVIDIRNNYLKEFPDTLVSSLRNGRKVLFAGNPLHCNCAARPLKHFILEQSNPSENLQNIYCKSPPFMQGQSLQNAADENLHCAGPERLEYNEEIFSELTDVKYRDFKINGNGDLVVNWFVTSTKDIADFIIYIRDQNNKILLTINCPYNIRHSIFSSKAINMQQLSVLNAEICIVSKNSEGSIGRWFKEQCQKISRIPFSTSHKSSSTWSKVNISYFILILIISLLMFLK